MSSIFSKIFDSRSKEEKQRDFENYSNRIFPYGEAQKEKVFAILAELLPKQNQKYVRMHYILMKEQMVQEEPLSFTEADAKIAKKTLLKTNAVINNIINNLLEVDLGIDENLVYPNIEELKVNAKLS
jgi:protein-disulfide isomerase